ncbi:MAG: YibE/F family protein [Patescibacteria group bacterium]
MIKKSLIFIFLLALLLSAPFSTNAKTDEAGVTFKAKVIKVLAEKMTVRDDGSTAIQQNLLLKGLSGDFKGTEITSLGIGDFDVVSIGVYKIGDAVYVDSIANNNGETSYFVTDYIRTNWLYVLAIIFILATVIIGGQKGFKSLLGLILSFIVIVALIIPQLLNGASPLAVAILGSLLVMVIIIYVTDGFNKKSHLAVLTVFISLILTLILAYLFTWLTRLSGFSTEEATLLIGTSAGNINFQGLLLAGILIGAVGVLDDIILGQIEAVAQIKSANSKLPDNQVFKMAVKIGQTHLGAIVNTLFLTYVGVSLPLLMLFYLSPAGSVDFLQVINNNVIATEIVRALVGSIGLMLSMPIATYLASKFLK